MRRSVIAGSLFAAGLALSVTAPVDAAPTSTGPVGASAVLLGSAWAHYDFTFDVDDGQAVSTKSITVAPGEVIDWGADPANVVALVESGTLTSYRSCSEKAAWEAGHVFPATSYDVVKNEGKGPAVVLAVVSHTAAKAKAPHAGHDFGSGALEPLEAPAACPTGTAAKSSDHGAGLSVGSSQFSQMSLCRVIPRPLPPIAASATSSMMTAL